VHTVRMGKQQWQILLDGFHAGQLSLSATRELVGQSVTEIINMW
jgi:hypothetical protein